MPLLQPRQLAAKKGETILEASRLCPPLVTSHRGCIVVPTNAPRVKAIRMVWVQDVLKIFRRISAEVAARGSDDEAVVSSSWLTLAHTIKEWRGTF